MWQKFLSALGLIFIIFIAAGIGKQMGRAVVAPEKPSPQKVQNALAEGLENAARQINERGPMMIDNDTRIDRASVGPGARFTYHYTFPGYSSREIDASLLRANLEPAVRSQVCRSKDMARSLELGTTYVYSYTGRDGAGILSFEVSRRDCGS